MDEESKSSIRSGESVPNPIYEEVVVDGISTDNLGIIEKNNEKYAINANDETTTATPTTFDAESNDDDDDDDDYGENNESGDDDDDDNHSSSSNSNSSSSSKSSATSYSSCSITDERGKDDNNDNDDNRLTDKQITCKNPTNLSSVVSTQVKTITKIMTASKKLQQEALEGRKKAEKSPNIKLLLKKPKGYEVTPTVSEINSSDNVVLSNTVADDTPSTIIKVKTPTKPVFLVTVVSNTSTGPAYTTATYSPAGATQAQLLQQVTNNSDINSNAPAPQKQVAKISIQENSIELKSKIDEKLVVSTDPGTNTSATSTLKTSLAATNNTINTKNETTDEKLNSISNKTTICLDDPDDIDSIKSDQDQEIKSSTPKIARELVQLQKTVSESKVLTEYINDSAVTKNRKSKKLLLSSNKNISGVDNNERLSPINQRRSRSRSSSKSRSRIDSPCNDVSGGVNVGTGDNDSRSPSLGKWPSDERINKRTNMRSQNSEFIQKHMKFLNRCNNADAADTDNSDTELQSNETKSIPPPIESQLDIIKKNYLPPPKRGWDPFCWKCATCGDLIPCSKCIRSYHIRCLKSQAPNKIDKEWMCPECNNLEAFMRGILRSGKVCLAADHLNQLMEFALKRMKQQRSHEKFLDNFDEDECPDYYKYIINPVTLSTIQMKLENRSYKCSEELVSEVKWIQHNATIYFGNSNKITTLAKQLVKVCRQEVNEIETCPECYYNANTKNDWFIEVCSRPHILLWAKLKGFPYWPAKSMGCTTTVVNVRFFGAHDRAHVPIKDCYLYCEKDPNPITKQQNKRNLIAGSIKEVDDHIQKIILKFGEFKYAPFKTLYDPNNELKQLETMIPGVTEYIENTQLSLKPALTYKIVKTADNHLSMIKKTDGVNGELRRLSGGNNDSTNNVGSIATNKLLKKANSTSTIENEKNSSATLAATNTNITNRKNNEEITKSYEVVAKATGETNDASNKVNSVILKRKSDNWNAITVSSLSTAVTSPPLSSKRHKMSSDDKDKNNIEKLESEINSISNSVAEKRKLLSDDVQLHQTQKPKLSSNENEIVSTTTTTKSTLVTSSNTTVSKKSNSNKLEENLTIRIGNSKITGKPVVLSSSLNKNRQEEQKTSQTENSTKLNDKEKCNTETQNKEIVNDTNVIVKIEQENENTKTNKSSNGSNSKEKNVSQIVETRENQSDRIQHNKRDVDFQSNDQNVKARESKKLQIGTTEPVISNNKKPTKENESIRSKKISDSSTLSSQITPLESSTSAQQQSLNKGKTNEINSNTKNSNKILVNVHNLIKTPLIPFTEIKTEKPDTDDENQNNSNSTTNSTSDTTTTSVTFVKNTEQNLQQKAKMASKRPSDTLSKQNTAMRPSSSTSMLPSTTEPVIVKTEICSDNEENPSQTLAMTNSSSALSAKSNIPSSTTLNSSDKVNSQRICVKDFATIRTQSQSLPSRKIEKKLPSTTCITRLDMKKRNQRARKSFPNKGNMPAPMMALPLSTVIAQKSSSNGQQQQQQQFSKQNINSMVYIPLDTKTTTSLQKSIPIPLLTAVSKISVNNQQQQLPTTTVTSIVTPTTTTTIAMNTNPINITMTKVMTTNSSSLLNTIKTAPTTTAAVADTQTNGSNNGKEQSKKPEHHMLSGFVTPSLASAITETIVRGPPKLAPKPSGPLRSDGDFIFPTEAGPVCKTLMENAHKMTDFFRTVIEDTLSDMANNGILEAKIQLLELEIEKLKHSHTKELTELKHNTDLMLCEMRSSLENEKQRLISETRKQCEIERIRAVEEAKKKQWCANCGKEAQFYCCWNTSYCDYPCQQKHWSRHMNSCAQNDNPDASAQKVGVKIQSFNIKDKLNRLSKEIQIPRLPPNTFLRPASITAQAQRNAVPIHRLVSIPVPITTAPQPRFTLLNREGNWELMNATGSPQTNYHQPHRLQITTSSSSSSSSSSPSPSSTIMQEISNCGAALVSGSSNNGKVSSSTILALPPNINIIRSNKL